MRGGVLRFAFYGRVSTEDWQDPVTSRARQLQQAVMLTAGAGVITAEFFDTGSPASCRGRRRPQAAALVAQLADPERGWDAVVIGEYERAFYGSQYASMAPLFEHYGVSLWMPEVGGRVDWHAEDHEQTMVALGLSSKREITRTRVRVRTAMAAQTLEQGRYLGGRPPYGYRLADAGPHPNKAHAAWGRRAHRLEPDPVTAPVVTWMFGQRLAGHSAARITRALNDAGVPCPSAADPGRNPHRAGSGWTLRTVAAILANPGIRGGRCGTGSRPRRSWSTRPTPAWGTSRCSGGTCPRAGSSPSIPRTRRWSARPTSSPRRTRPRRAARPGPRSAGTCWPGCIACGRCGRRLESAWSYGRPAYRCRHGYSSATVPDPARPKNTYVREDQVLPHLAALAILLAASAGTGPESGGSAQLTGPADRAALIDRLRADGTVLTYDPDDRTLHAGDHDAPSVVIGKDAMNSLAPDRRGGPPRRKRRKRAPAAAGG